MRKSIVLVFLRRIQEDTLYWQYPSVPVLVLYYNLPMCMYEV